MCEYVKWKITISSKYLIYAYTEVSPIHHHPTTPNHFLHLKVVWKTERDRF